MEQIPLDTSPPEEVQIPLPTTEMESSSNVALPADVVEKRTAKTSFGLDRPYGEVNKVLKAGNEDSLRTEASAQIDAKVQQKAQETILRIASERRAPLTTEEKSLILDEVSRAEKFTHPRSVIEKEFSNRYFGALYVANTEPTNWYNTYVSIDPKGEGRITNLGKDYSAKSQVYQTLRENAQAAYEAQSYGSYGLDILKDVASFGLYGEYKLRNLAPGVGVANLLGSNLEQQRVNRLTMPLNEFTETATKIVDGLIKDNPAKAIEWLDAMQGNADKDMGNLMSLITLGTAPGLATIGKAAFRTGDAIAAAAVKKATTDMVKGTASTEPIKISQAVAAGDLKEAAIQRTTAEVVKNATGGDPVNPLVDQVKSLPTAFRERAEAMAANPGNGPGAQEISNRLAQRFRDAGDSILNVIANFQRANRTPAAFATEDSVRLLADAHVRDNYKGQESTVLNIKSTPPEKLTNTRHWELQIGDYDGTMFADKDQAAANAITRGIVLKGNAASARQLELQQLMAATEYDLKTARAAQKTYTGETPGFKTAKGSTYIIHADGTTTRNKALRSDPGHEGDQGLKPRSHKTVYLDEADANALAPPQGRFRIVDHENGTVSTITPNPKEGWGISPGQRNIKYSTTPEVGKTPLELWTPTTVKGLNAYGNIHFGNPIVEVNQASKLGLTAANKTANFEQNIKNLETNFVKYQDELAQLRSMPGASIEQQGGRFYISKFDPFNETSKVTRSLLLSTQEANKTTGFLRSYLGAWRTGEDTLSKDNIANAKIAIYGKNRLLAMARAELADVNSLKRWAVPGTKAAERVRRVNDALMAGRTEGLMRSNGELEDFWQRHYGSLPSEKESSAYFAAVRYGELQDVLTSVDMYTNEARLGTKFHSIQILDKKGNPTASPFFKGIIAAEAPHSGEGILIMGERLGDERITTSSGLRNNKTLMADIQNGKAKLIQVLYHNDSPLKGFGNLVGDNHVKYVVTRTSEEAPLGFTKIDKNGGGLWDMDYQHYMKQAKMVYDQPSKTWRYKGDTTVIPFNNGSLGRDVMKIIDEVRVKLLAKDEAGAAEVAKRQPVPWQELKGWFAEKTMPDGTIVPPRLSLTEPFKIVPGNRLIVNMDDELRNRGAWKGKFRDDTKGILIHQNLIKTGEHDSYELYTVTDKGSRGSPLYNYEPAEYIDPIPSLNRAFNRIVDSIYMDDYKLSSVEHWIQEFGRYLKNVSPRQLERSPMHHFLNSKEYIPGTPADIVNRAEDARYKAQQIWGTPTKLETQLNSIAQHMADATYSRFGPKMLDPSSAFSAAGNVAGKLKAMTYHTTIGLFAWPQMLVQNMTFATIMGIEGVGHATTGAAATIMHQYARLHPASIDTLDAMISKFYVPSISNRSLIRWKPGELKEAHNLLSTTGFDLVASEHALFKDVNVLQSGADKFLDAGSWFFREGEKNVRIGAWYTAYRKFREINPAKVIDDADMRWLINRADMLAGNMSNASKSALQRGPLAFTTQFLGYNLRLAELMLGKGRLTATERARLVTTYWGLFGVSAAGLTGVPIGDSFRKAFIDHGYTAEPGAFSTFFTEGIPAAATQMVTGKLYGIGQRYSSPGFDPIREVLAGDKPLWQIATGASGSMLKSAWETSSGFRQALLSMARRDDKDSPTYFPLTASDLVQPLKTISSFNAGARYEAALRTANWLNKNGQKVDSEVSPLNASIMTATGVQEQKVYNLQDIRAIEKERKDTIEKTEKEWLAVGRKWIQAQRDRDWEQGKAYGKQMNALLELSGYPREKMHTLFSRLDRDNQTLIDQADFSLYNRNIKPGEGASRQETYKKVLQQRDAR